ncbi:MAG: inositol monophosphatase family protein [Candidatus Caenarcaniphilales bacterium]|nr:inositol monophosphatase family protein [Candidatus Caenarcaniphilales bacterium]
MLNPDKVKEFETPSKEELKVMLSLAIKAAERAGRIIYRYWGDLDEAHIQSKSSWRDLVTIADKEAEGAILALIESEYPDHEIISEEGGGAKHHGSKSVFQWAIDPLDGTMNFRHSYPFFAVSIGLIYDGEPLLGVIYDPIKDELFTGIKGSGAFLNGRPLTVSDTGELKDALLVTGFAYHADDLQEYSLKLFQKLNFATHGIRRDGSAALDLAYVAAGRFDGFWEYGLKLWDIAAGIVILREAGGSVSRLDGSVFDLKDPQILATNATLKNALIKFLN